VHEYVQDVAFVQFQLTVVLGPHAIGGEKLALQVGRMHRVGSSTTPLQSLSSPSPHTSGLAVTTCSQTGRPEVHDIKPDAHTPDLPGKLHLPPAMQFARQVVALLSVV
jgi:hypothetical protein